MHYKNLESLPPWAIIKCWRDAMYPSYGVMRPDTHTFFVIDNDGFYEDTDMSCNSISRCFENIKIVDTHNEKQHFIDLFNEFDDHYYDDDDTEFYIPDPDEE